MTEVATNADFAAVPAHLMDGGTSIQRLVERLVALGLITLLNEDEHYVRFHATPSGRMLFRQCDKTNPQSKLRH